MKMILVFCLICVIPAITGTISEQQPNKIMYATIGNTVQIPCTAKVLIKAAKWRKDNQAFFDDSTVNANIPGYQRFTVRNFNDTSNVLQISNITEDDFGVYECILQTKKDVLMQNICLKPFEYTTVISIITQPPVEQTTNYLEVRLTTEFTEAVDQTGLFSQFNIGVLTTVFGVILCGTVGCYFILRKYRNYKLDKRSDNEDTQSVQIGERMQTNAEVENLDRSNSDDSHYETINETEMLNFPLNEQSIKVEIHKRMKDAPCHDVIDEKDQTNETSTENFQGIQDEDGKILDHILEHVLSSTEKLNEPCVAYSVTELNIEVSMQSGGNTPLGASQIECNAGDGYLFPYTSLNVNDMEYLHSYSTLLKTTTDSSTSNIGLDENSAAFDYQYKGRSDNSGDQVFLKNENMNSCDICPITGIEEPCISVVENNNSEDIKLFQPLIDVDETPSKTSRINDANGNTSESVSSVISGDTHPSKETSNNNFLNFL